MCWPHTNTCIDLNRRRRRIDLCEGRCLEKHFNPEFGLSWDDLRMPRGFCRSLRRGAAASTFRPTGALWSAADEPRLLVARLHPMRRLRNVRERRQEDETEDKQPVHTKINVASAPCNRNELLADRVSQS